jgi:pimeloyl-ACP methyl ester carboxylesterase
MKPALIILLFLLSTVEFSRAQSFDITAADTTHFGRNPAAGHWLQTRGFKMYYETYGSGTPLLMIHGNGGSISDFVFQVPYFAKKYRVIVADSRAQGKSIDAGDSLSYEMMADDLNALLDSLHLDSCYVIGWSDGAINGLLLTIRHPDKVKKLAITGANLVPDTSAVDPWVWKWAIRQSDSLQRLPKTPEVKVDLKLTRLLTFEPNITLKQLHTISCPTLVIGGDHDILVPKHQILIADNIKRSYLWILPNSGHSTPIFYHDMFNQVVGDFFANPYRVIEKTGRFY